MDKKNTLLLTVIAVATLLVAVVGATFAYFSISATGNATTTATVNTGKVGTIVYKANDANKALVLGVSANDMAQGEADVKYYSVAKPTEWDDTKFVHGNAATALEVATVNLSGAQKGDTYTCDATLTVTAAGTMLGKYDPTGGENANTLRLNKTGWLTLTLTGEGIIDKEENSSLSTPIDLSTFASDEENTDPESTGVTETYNIKGLTLVATDAGTDSKTLSALVTLNNSHEDNQNSIAGTSLTVTVKLEPVAESCKVTSAAIPGA